MKTADRARYAAVRDAACAALERGIGGRWELPRGGLLSIERPLPFLVIGHLGEDDAIARLTGGLGSRLILSSARSHRRGGHALAEALVQALAERSRALLLVWVSEARASSPRDTTLLRVKLPFEARWGGLDSAFTRALANVPPPENGARALVSVEQADAPRDSFDLEDHLQSRVCELELRVAPRHRDATGAARYPLRLHAASRALAAGLSHAAEAFADRELRSVRPRPRLGAAVLDPAARRADAILCEADDAFEVLVQLTPARLDRVWQRLVDTDFQEEPQLDYRPLPFDPMVLKRRVFDAPVEIVEDPLVAELLREKQDELDRLLSMLRDRGETFLHESELLYGKPDAALLRLAHRILATPRGANEKTDDDDALSIDAVLERTRAHMRRYREQDPFFPDEIELRDDTAAGMMVLRGRLVLRTDLEVSASRLDALLEHEVGTHVLTWFNGSAQGLRLLGRGLAGYEGLQEGLAVLAEHLAGALDPARLRILSARVVAADAVSDGASFLEIFHRLRDDHGIGRRAAFQTALRASRGGGLTKDLVYLRGLSDVIAYVQRGGSLERLYTGKLALRHLDTIGELVDRGLVTAPRVVPLILRREETAAKLTEIRTSADAVGVVTGMVDRSAA